MRVSEPLEYRVVVMPRAHSKEELLQQFDVVILLLDGVDYKLISPVRPATQGRGRTALVSDAHSYSAPCLALSSSGKMVTGVPLSVPTTDMIIHCVLRPLNLQCFTIFSPRIPKAAQHSTP
jgi:hypothetical protein